MPQTKDCLDPWSFLLIKANGNVHLCCWSHPVGNINESDLDAIVSGESAQQLRRSLLAGELMPVCQGCSARQAVDTSRLESDVEKYLADSANEYAVAQGVLVRKHAHVPASSATDSGRAAPGNTGIRAFRSSLAKKIKRFLRRLRRT